MPAKFMCVKKCTPKHWSTRPFNPRFSMQHCYYFMPKKLDIHWKQCCIKIRVFGHFLIDKKYLICSFSTHFIRNCPTSFKLAATFFIDWFNKALLLPYVLTMVLLWYGLQQINTVYFMAGIAGSLKKNQIRQGFQCKSQILNKIAYNA